jgi:predicted O-methyltransferase YrrM
MAEMILEPEQYFRTMVKRRDPLLAEMEEHAVKNQVPIIGPLVGELLYVLAGAMGAENILELGTATGYSAIFLARGSEAVRGKVITMENDAEIALTAKSNFVKAEVGDRIEIHIGDAREEIGYLEGPFDMIFLDIDKESYELVLPDCKRLLRKGGLLVADNVGFKSAEPFNEKIKNDMDFRPVHLLSFLPFHSPEKDGLCLALRV